MSNIKKELIDFETHCFETGQLQVGELMSTAIMHIAELEKELSSIVSGLFSENELAILKLEQQANGAIKLTNVAMKKLQSPKCSQSRLEYFKAGVRALAFAIDKESKALKEQGK